MITIPFVRPDVSPDAIALVAQSLASGQLSGDGPFTARAHRWLEQRHPGRDALLVHSGTAALELAALLLDLQPGDEVIMPSFTFTSTANAVALRGAVPVFVDVDEGSLNLDPDSARAAITSRTRAILVVHYAGIAADMDAFTALARAHGLALVEDAAQGLGATWRDQPLGAIGDLGCLSFHATKNIAAGEGGALLLQPAFSERAEILREKGTDRSRFLRGAVDKYTWRDVGSSYLPADFVAALLCAQLERCDDITATRRRDWWHYHAALEPLEALGVLQRPVVSPHAGLNGHIYFMRCRSREARTSLIAALADAGIQATFHYQPLHESPAGRRVARVHGSLERTERAAHALVRLPLWPGIAPHLPRITDAVAAWATRQRRVTRAA
jgi:dTDP-4-amino-4,6-dideoxygalactose transaminase